MRAAGRHRFTRLSHDKSPRGHQPSPPPLWPMVELNQRTGRDPGNTSEPIITRRTQASHWHCPSGWKTKTHLLLPLAATCINGLVRVCAAPTPPSPGESRGRAAVQPATAEGRCWPVDQGPVSPLPYTTPSGPRTLTTACGFFQIHNSTSDPQTRGETRSDKDAEGSLGFPALTECPG